MLRGGAWVVVDPSINQVSLSSFDKSILPLNLYMYDILIISIFIRILFITIIFIIIIIKVYFVI